MHSIATSALIAISLLVAIAAGRRVHHLLPESHLTGDTKDTVKVAVGLVATMSALLLGLLVGGAKDSYDTVRAEVVQMAAQATFLDRGLSLYGPEGEPVRALFHAAAETMVRQMWLETDQAHVGWHQGDAFFLGLQRLTPRDDTQRLLKDQATAQAVELGRMRMLLRAQSLQTLPRTLLVVVVLWLAAILFGSAVVAPANSTACVALTVAALSVAGAFLLIMELSQPFRGMIRVSDEPLTHVLSQFKAASSHRDAVSRAPVRNEPTHHPSSTGHQK